MPSRDRGVSTYVIILIVAAAMLLLFAIYAVVRHYSRGTQASSGAGRPALTEEQKAYLPMIVFSDARMSAAENFLGATVYYLDVRAANQGSKAVASLAVQLSFVDVLNQVVLRDTAHILTERMPPLKPGETRSFRVSFDHMPADWNQAPPMIRVVGLEF